MSNKRERESGYKTDLEYYEGEWENLQNELLDENDGTLNPTTKFELRTIMVGEDAPGHDLDAATKYKFLDTIRINRNYNPIDRTLDELSWRLISNEKKDEIRELLEIIRTDAQEGGRKSKRTRRRKRRKRRKRKTRKRKRKKSRKKRKHRRKYKRSRKSYKILKGGGKIYMKYFPIMKEREDRIEEMITYYKKKPLPERRKDYFNKNYYEGMIPFNERVPHDFNKKELKQQLKTTTRIALFRIYPYYLNLELELEYIDNLKKQTREDRIKNINKIVESSKLNHTESFELQDNRIEKWVNLQKTVKCKKICETIKDNITHISFDAFLRGLQNSFKKFLNKIEQSNKNYIIIISDTRIKKSNYWCVLLIMNIINENNLKQPFDVLANTRDALLLYNKEELKNIEYVILDDCSYSGSQLVNHIKNQTFEPDSEMDPLEYTRDMVGSNKNRFTAIEKLNYNTKDTSNYFNNLSNINDAPPINVVVCAITNNAKKLLEEKKIEKNNIFADRIIDTLKDIFKDDMKETNDIIYYYFKFVGRPELTITFFDHKFPDNDSIIFRFVPLGIISRRYKDGDEIVENNSNINIGDVFNDKYKPVTHMLDNKIYYCPFIENIFKSYNDYETIRHGSLITPIYKRQEYKLPISILNQFEIYKRLNFE
jgi:hypothetical protein